MLNTASLIDRPAETVKSLTDEKLAGWQRFEDEQYGYELQYPADWTFQEVALRYPELDKPLVRVVQFLPKEWAEKLGSGGRPDPNQPPLIAPLAVEVSVGSVEEYRHLYVEPTNSEVLELGGNQVTLEEYASGDIREIRYIFQHPQSSALRVTLRDQLSGFPDRVPGNEAVIDLVNQILTTFTFTG
jgi:hypothetical protein